jgi:hypothetical protein
MDLKELIDEIRKDPMLAHVGTFTKRGACRHCGCFLSLQKEDDTSYHERTRNGRVSFVVVYNGKFYCQACHRMQVEV